MRREAVSFPQSGAASDELAGTVGRVGVDVSDADDLTRALQDKALMERVRKDAETDGAIEAGITIASMMVGVRRIRRMTKRATSSEAVASAKEAIERRNPEIYQRRVKQLEINSRNGRIFEKERATYYRERGLEVGEQLTIVTPSGKKGRPDLVLRDPSTGNLTCVECKASEAARLRTGQLEFLRDVEASGGTIAGKGKPGFEGEPGFPQCPLE